MARSDSPFCVDAPGVRHREDRRGHGGVVLAWEVCRPESFGMNPWFLGL
jgi:hypothetical protein